MNILKEALEGEKPVISLEAYLEDFPKEGGVLRTGRFVRGWYTLSNDDVTVLVDTIRPRVYGVYVHGRFGTIQNLIYNTNVYEQQDGLWGVVPAFHIAGKRFLPFNHMLKGASTAVLRSFPNEPKKVVLDESENRVRLEEITCFMDDPKMEATIESLSMDISLNRNALKVHVDYPESAWKTELMSFWYPLYTNFYDLNVRGKLLYQQQFETVLSNSVTLFDREGRVPQLRVSSPSQHCRIEAKADREAGEAFKLYVTTEGLVRGSDVFFEFIPNPVTIKVNPLLNADKEQKLTVLSSETPKVFVDEREISVKKVSDEKYYATVKFAKGRHEIKAISSAGKSRREIYAVANPVQDLVKTADALLFMQWKTPELYGLFPDKYWMDDLTPFYEGTRADNPAVCGGGAWTVASCLAYAHRVIPNLVSAAVITKDKNYVTAVWNFIEKFVEKSHQFEDGDLMPPVHLSQDGSPRKEASSWARPRYQHEMVRDLLYAWVGFNLFVDSEKAEKCLDYAYRYAHTLKKMQAADGGLYALYIFPSLEVASTASPGWGIEGDLMAVYELTEIIKEHYPEKAKELRDIVSKAVEYAEKAGMLKTWCGETSIHTVGIWHSISTLCLLRYLLNPRDKQYAEYAKEAFNVSILLSYMYIDNPSTYLFAESQGSEWFAEKGGFPKALVSRGDTMDGSSSLIGLRLKKYLNHKLGEVVANYNFAGRLATSIMENGAVSGLEIYVPNYYYKKEDFSWENNHMGIGFNGVYYLTGEIF